MTQNYRNFAIVAGLIFVIQAYRWTLNLQVFLIACAINIPLIALFVLAHWFAKKTKKKFVKNSITVLCSLAFLGWGIVTLAMEYFGRSVTVVTNPYWYGEILHGLNAWNPELVKHFPASIPKNARNIRFSFTPGFLQGGMHAQLRYSVNAQEMEQLYGRFSQMSQKSIWGGDTNVHVNDEEGMPTTFFYTNDVQEPNEQYKYNDQARRYDLVREGMRLSTHFPEDYEIMIFDKVLKKEDRPPDSPGITAKVTASRLAGLRMTLCIGRRVGKSKV